jgi:methionyl-tRNA synthetase
VTTMITATPPTPNGELHLGHLSGPYLAADVFRRFLELKGEQAWYSTGIDDHQTYTAKRGEQDGRTAGRVADDFGDRIEDAWRASAAAPDVCVRPRSSARHVAFVSRFFRALVDDGFVVPRNRPLPYCTRCASPRFEAYVRGVCPHCGEVTGGNACEDCGEPNDCGDLRDATCTICGEPTVLRDVERLYFPLRPFEDELSDYWSRVELPPHLAALCNRMLAKGLPEIAVSHPGNWGIPVPLDAFSDQRIYVWCEMAPGYLVQAEELAVLTSSRDGWAGFWKSEDVRIVQFFGFDNGYFHAALFPALFHAFDVDIRLPDSFVLNEFYRLDGDKFSTSRNHAVWVLDALRERPLDALRYTLCRDRPNGRLTNYSAARTDAHTSCLRSLWQGWLRDLGERVVAHDGGRSPACNPLVSAHHGHTRRYIGGLGDAVAESFELPTFSPAGAIRTLEAAIHRLWAFGLEFEHLAGGPDPDAQRVSAIALELAGVHALSTFAYPLLPEAAIRIRGAIGCPDPAPGDWDMAGMALQPGSDVSGLADVELLG